LHPPETGAGTLLFGGRFRRGVLRRLGQCEPPGTLRFVEASQILRDLQHLAAKRAGAREREEHGLPLIFARRSQEVGVDDLARRALMALLLVVTRVLELQCPREERVHGRRLPLVERPIVIALHGSSLPFFRGERRGTGSISVEAARSTPAD